MALSAITSGSRLQFVINGTPWMCLSDTLMDLPGLFTVPHSVLSCCAYTPLLKALFMDKVLFDCMESMFLSCRLITLSQHIQTIQIICCKVTSRICWNLRKIFYTGARTTRLACIFNGASQKLRSMVVGSRYSVHPFTFTRPSDATCTLGKYHYDAGRTAHSRGVVITKPSVARPQDSQNHLCT